MIATLLAGLTLAAPAPLKMHVSGASLFKNGYAVIFREANIKGSGDFLLSEIPQASLGTLWLMTSDGTKLTAVVNTAIEKTTQTEVPLASLSQILSANIGKKLTISERNHGVVTGTLLSVTEDILLMKDDRHTFTLNKGQITDVSSDEALIYKSKVSSMTRERGLRFSITSPCGGKLYMVSLERGAMWTPAYAVDITDPNKLRITAKATVMNDLEDFGDSEMKFVTGFPNLPFAGLPDPLTAPATTDQLARDLDGMAPGGFGGQAGRRFENRAGMSSQVAAAPADMNSMGTIDIGSSQAEDLFFYTKPHMSLKKGERGYVVLFEAEAAYEHVYTWDVDDTTVNNIEYRPPSDEPGEVWHSLKFKNTSKLPFTTGTAMTLKDGQILGQDVLHYTSTNAEAEVKITKAMEVRAEAVEEEATRELGAIKFPDSKTPRYDLITLTGKLTIQNRKSEAVKMKVTKQLTGQTASADHDAKVTKTAKGLREINPRSQLVWNEEIQPGKTLTLTYTYKLYVNSSR